MKISAIYNAPISIQELDVSIDKEVESPTQSAPPSPFLELEFFKFSINEEKIIDSCLQEPMYPDSYVEQDEKSPISSEIPSIEDIETPPLTSCEQERPISPKESTKPPRSPRKLTEQERMKIIELRRQEEPIANISRLIKRPRSTIGDYLKSLRYLDPLTHSKLPTVVRTKIIEPKGQGESIKPLRSARKLTEQERIRIIALRCQGKIISNISRIINRPESTISDYLKRLRYLDPLTHNQFPLIVQTKIIQEIPSSSKESTNAPRKLIDEERIKIVELRCEGKTITNISRIINRPKTTIRDYLKRLKYSHPSTYRTLTRADKTKIMGLRQQGESIRTIATALGKPIDKIRNYLYQTRRLG